MHRRDFVRLLSAAAAATAFAGTGARAASAPFRAIVVGGGMAGATAAKYLRLWGGPSVSVTLIESHARYTSCIMSNKVLTGERSLASLVYRYTALRDKYGVQILRGTVAGIDPVRRNVTLADSTRVSYDRLILAPGIDFDYSQIPGMTKAAQDLVPHAWKAGPQTNALRAQLVNLPNGGNVVISIPKSPYRCPPGPYERACVIADCMRTRKPAATLIGLDSNAPVDVTNKYTAIQAEPVNFTRAFTDIHANIEYHSGVAINAVDAPGKRIDTSVGAMNYGVLNLIPPQQAGGIVMDSGLGLANFKDKWAGVDVLSYESTAQPNIHVIGDSMGSTQPKAGHIGNQEAKVCADAILRMQNGSTPYPSPVTNSACYTPITARTATWLTGVFAYDKVTKTMAIVGGKATEPADGPSATSYEQMNTWFASLMADTFA